MPKPKVRHISEYLRVLYKTAVFWVDNSIMGATNIKPQDIMISMTQEDHKDIEEVVRTITHEIVHRTHKHPDQRTLALDAKQEKFTEQVTEELMSHPTWQMGVHHWLLIELWDLLRAQALGKPVS